MTQKNEIIGYDKVSDLYKDLGLPITQQADFSLHELHKIHTKVPYKSPVFRANYYSFVFIKSGTGSYTTDEQTFNYISKTIYFTNPGHIKAFAFTEMNEVYLVTMNERFLKQNVHKDIFDEFPFLLAETVRPQFLSDEKFAEFELLYKQVLDAYNSDSEFKFKIIGNLFVIILLKLKEGFWADYEPLGDENRGSQIVRTFKEHLEHHFRDLSDGQITHQFQAKDFAELQHLNASYLTTVIKSKTGKSITSWINEKALAQAQALLAHTNESVKEIGYRLGYADTAHFSKFFKKQSGQSPTEFRTGLQS
ncbi:AraC family transcriptional regulator [bacterium]|nr:MAG: AraC family transcriptional regulator [bacterium]